MPVQSRLSISNPVLLDYPIHFENLARNCFRKKTKLHDEFWDPFQLKDNTEAEATVIYEVCAGDMWNITEARMRVRFKKLFTKMTSNAPVLLYGTYKRGNDLTVRNSGFLIDSKFPIRDTNIVEFKVTEFIQKLGASLENNAANDPIKLIFTVALTSSATAPTGPESENQPRQKLLAEPAKYFHFLKISYTIQLIIPRYDNDDCIDWNDNEMMMPLNRNCDCTQQI